MPRSSSVRCAKNHGPRPQRSPPRRSRPWAIRLDAAEPPRRTDGFAKGTEHRLPSVQSDGNAIRECGMTERIRKKSNVDLRSRRWLGVHDLRAFGHRSRLKQMGYGPEDYADRPVIAIVNTWSDINHCHAHFKDRV